MRIGFVTRKWWPAVGGIESASRHVARELARTHDVVVATESTDTRLVSRLEASHVISPPRFEAFDDDGVRVVPVRVPASRRALLAPLAAQAAPGLRRYAWGRNRVVAAALYARVVGPLLAEQLGGSDVIHVWGGDLPAAGALHAGRLLGVPVVLTPFAHRGQWGTDPLGARVYRAADRVLALLDDDASLYRELGVASDRIRVVGIASPGVEPGRGGALRARLGIDGPLVLFLGRRVEHKGFELVRAAAAEIADTTFAFVGPGDAVEGERIVDAGPVDERELAGWLDAADVLCLPSSGEILPSSFLEAWSVGTPVVTSDIAPLAELVAKTGGGLSVPRTAAAVRDALAALAADPARARELGASGRDYWRAHYSVPAVTAAHEAVYDEVASGRRQTQQAA